MLQLEEMRLALVNAKPDLEDLSDAINYKGLEIQVNELEHKAAEPGFWDDLENSQRFFQKPSSLKSV